MCAACWQRHPDRPFVRVAGLITTLDEPPAWLADFAAHIAGPYSPARAAVLITKLGQLLTDGGRTHPPALIERARHDGRSMGSLAKALQDFFTINGLALPTDQDARLAAGRRRRRLNAVPAPLKPAVERFAGHLLAMRERARRAGTRPRADTTIEHRLSTMRDFAQHLTATSAKTDWATINVYDVEAFLQTAPALRRSRLSVLRQFFRFARTQHIVLIDPTRELHAHDPRGFRGTTVDLATQRRLFRRWTTSSDAHPHEAFVGLLALLHGASSHEVRLLTVNDIDPDCQTVHLGRRPIATELDPATWTALQRCLTHRHLLATGNPHVIVTKVTKTASTPASTAYLSHVLDPAGVAPKHLRSTRLLDLAANLDPKLVAAAFGLTAETVLPYLVDRIDPTRLPATTAN
jgi:site-specific recombinase XerD